MNDRTTKDRVVDAAIQLFFQKGFDATSTRDITNRIRVNGSLISYHFNGKQGLLEEIVVSYYEGLIQCIESAMDQPIHSAEEYVKGVVKDLFLFKYRHFYESTIVHRELALDSTFVREVLTTYIRKENYYLTRLFTVEHEHEASLYVMQLKGMMISPFLLHHEWKKDAFSRKVDQRLCLHYITHIHQWIESIEFTKGAIPTLR